jgi:hypothetical protein
MRRYMGRVPLMTAPPMAYPAITMTDKYVNSGDEKGKKLDVPKRLVGIGEVDLCFFRGTGSVRIYLSPLYSCIPDGILWRCLSLLGKRCATFRAGLPERGILRVTSDIMQRPSGDMSRVCEFSLPISPRVIVLSFMHFMKKMRLKNHCASPTL